MGGMFGGGGSPKATIMPAPVSKGTEVKSTARGGGSQRALGSRYLQMRRATPQGLGDSSAIRTTLG